MYFQYDTLGAPLGFIYNGVQYFYITNQMGDVIAITDAQGNKLVEYEYDEWGILLSYISYNGNYDIACKNPLLYRGYYYDNETGYYYLQSRYYDPTICRFINSDIAEISQMSKDIPVGTNLFAYCCNDPINNSDIDGQIAITAGILVLIGAVVGFVTSFILSAIISRAVNPNISGKALWSGALIDGIGGAISGAVAVLPCGWVIQALVNAIIAGATYIAFCKVMHYPISQMELITSVTVGAVTGAFSGGGILKKYNGKVNVSTVIKESNKTIARELRRSNTKYAAKATKAAKNRISYYVSNAMWKAFVKFARFFGYSKIRSTKWAL
ncbi:MAG: RHS repeat domain-containing protein [Eubacterium sp.]